MEETTAVKLTETDSRARSNTRRIEQLERGQEMLTHIATSVEVLVSEQRHLREELENLTGKVDVLEQKPGQRWETVVDKVLLMAVGALVGFVLVQLGFQL